MEILITYDWPGNVRELENAVERALICQGLNPLRFDEFAGRGSCGSPHKLDDLQSETANLDQLLIHQEI